MARHRVIPLSLQRRDRGIIETKKNFDKTAQIVSPQEIQHWHTSRPAVVHWTPETEMPSVALWILPHRSANIFAPGTITKRCVTVAINPLEVLLRRKTK